MEIKLPELSLVVLIGPSGSGKSTFARRYFAPTEVLSSDFFRALVADDENDQGATKEAFEALHFVARKRLAGGRLTVIDATNVQPEARAPLVALARAYHVLPVAVVLDLPDRICIERNRQRTDRAFGDHVVRNQNDQLRRSLRRLDREGFRHVFVLRSAEEVETATVTRTPLWTNRKELTGPFDLIGDVHGCGDELRELLAELGYRLEEDGSVTPPPGRMAVFLGDLVDRGPDVAGVLELAMGMVAADTALAVPGNHEEKLKRKLEGKEVRIAHGLAESLAQLAAAPAELRERVLPFLRGLVSHYVLDGGKLVVAHAGLKEELQGRSSGAVRAFALYGETTGETDEFGLPVRFPWATEYRGSAMVVYGHTPVPEPEWLNRTINIDTGCVFGGRLTALRYPERELVSVPARQVYAQPARPLLPPRPELSAQQQADDTLDLDDVMGRRSVETRLAGRVTVREENAAAALEVMSRFAADPRWLIYLPPTLSPPETSRRPGLLEHPDEAFAYFAGRGVDEVVLEEKHMGSRAVVVVCRDAAAARRRFGVEGGDGILYTRTGRRFFADSAIESGLLDRLRGAAETAGIWEELATDWLCLDAELMPWSAKAQELLEHQYAPVGTAARVGLDRAVRALAATADRLSEGPEGPEAAEARALAERFAGRQERAGRYVEAYRRYCWEVAGLADLALAPFHLLASEGRVHTDRDHLWHLEILGRLCRAEGQVLKETAHLRVELASAESREAGIRFWEELTDRGGEGMVVKPRPFLHRGRKGITQPAIKVRGAEYLRIIYGPEYDAPEHLERLRGRGLSAKRSLALRELALGVESLTRFVEREPLRRVHEAVFAVLALESEPVDPRL